MGINKLNLFIDFDDVIISTRPRLEEQLFKAYKYASVKYWNNQRKILNEEYRKKIADLRTKEEKLKRRNVNVSSLLNKLYEIEMFAYTNYVRKLEEIDENLKYLGINIDYVLEILNNGCNYFDGDNPNSPYYIDYDQILDMQYAIKHSLDFLQKVMSNPNITPRILSHKNCNRESLRKKVIIGENIGDIEVHVLDFHRDSFSTGKRQFNSKAEYVMNLYGIDCLDESFVLIDDSKTNVLDWIDNGGKGILYTQEKRDGVKWQMQEMTYDAFFNCMDEEQKKLIKR